MDFVVAGLGFGALLVLAGYAVREFGFFLLVPTRIRTRFEENQSLASTWRERCRLASNTLIICGVAVWLIVAIAIAFGASDRTGSFLLAGSATLLSLAGGVAIFLTSTKRHHAAMEPANLDVSSASDAWAQTEGFVEDATEPLDAWKPSILPKPSSTIVEEMPPWNTVHEDPTDHPAAVAAIAEPAQVNAVSTSEALVAEHADPVMNHAVEAASAGYAPEEPDRLNGSDSLEHQPRLLLDASLNHSETGGVEPELIEEPTAELPIESVPESETSGEDAMPINQSPVLVEEPGPAETGTAGNGAGPRRFKSTLLSDLDEPNSVDINAKFKSSLLADLSNVRLPDDGPRFRSTALVDLAQSDNAGDETSEAAASVSPRPERR